jgi:hypothetical protein
MLLQVHDELVFELPEGDVVAASAVIERVMADCGAEPRSRSTCRLASTSIAERAGARRIEHRRRAERPFR